MNIYFFLGAILGALIFFLDNKFSQKKKTNWGIIPFLSVIFGAWVYLSPLQGDYFDLIYYTVILIVTFIVIKFIKKLSDSGIHIISGYRVKVTLNLVHPLNLFICPFLPAA